MSDLIDRQAAIDIAKELTITIEGYEMHNQAVMNYCAEIIKLPPIQPEPREIGYDDCANALLKMWMDNVLTDGEYYRIANKLNEKWGSTELPEPYNEVNT